MTNQEVVQAFRKRMPARSEALVSTGKELWWFPPCDGRLVAYWSEGPAKIIRLVLGGPPGASRIRALLTEHNHSERVR